MESHSQATAILLLNLCRMLAARVAPRCRPSSQSPIMKASASPAHSALAASAADTAGEGGSTRSYSTARSLK